MKHNEDIFYCERNWSITLNEFTRNISIKNLFFHDYFSNTAIKLSWMESILFGLIIGLYFRNVLLGFGIGLGLIILECIPVISVVYILLFSLMESVLIFRITTDSLPINQRGMAALLAFIVLVEMHRTTGKINCIALGHAMILFEEIIIAGLLYTLNHEVPLSVILILAGIYFLTCISFCRIIAILLLTISSVRLIYSYGQQFLSKPYIALFMVLLICYICTVYLWAYLGNDYLGLYRQKQFKKLLEEKENEIADIKSRMYEKYSVLAGQYQYYQTSICSSPEDRREFEMDWKHYLIYLESSSRQITFNQFFEKQKLYQLRRYKQNPYRINPKHTAKQRNKTNSSTVTQDAARMDTAYFTGVNDMKSLKKRYHDLLKIYHPDNQNGDSTISQQIQKEYEALCKKYQS